MVMALLERKENEGILIDPIKNRVEEEIARVYSEYNAEFDALPEGNYNITPPWWRKNTHTHHLTVFKDGTGLYRLFPRDGGSGLISFARGEISVKRGGTFNRIPQEAAFAVVNGPNPKTGRIEVLRLVAHFEGPSPKKRYRITNLLDKLG